MEKMPVIFVGHGDPMIALKINEMTETLKKIGKNIIEKHGEPKAILCISAHWYTKDTFIQSTEIPNQVYDMFGFPNELYEVKYPVKGSKELTKDVEKILGNEVKINDDWGIDHGTWTVFVHMFPEAKIPVVQLSVNANLSANKAYKLGEKLAKLREKSYLIVGSGNIVHNLRKIEWDNPKGTQEADKFDRYILENISKREDEKVIKYEEHEYSNYAVPTPDHFMPILYILGASQGEKPYIFNEMRELGSLSMTSYAFGL
ncbi:4,5-DOPA dioxygenase extradiol [Fusobacterium hwasookii]|uniref:4,5-DOPA-extradiol-dioxygenase n=1 Tax=Fusobacterium hwasookii TaxID=1583098 RepID=UPI000497B411|nr:4,5-DOPA dioxygenase extradiol [Fusobacterium hwasookii]ALQ37742.1 dioxygenase [Fusobacterium hwasookii ChDC F300]QNE69359.1 4,5-DOPA dioxygenase extradiol [Fusobacterium hwasookii]